MEIASEKTDIGVIIGRFQVPYLHEVHCQLIDSVIKRHPKVIIFLGMSPIKSSRNNPLDFECRRKMIQEKYPEVNILYIKDQHSNKLWSENLDESIGDITGPSQKVTLYGGRDSFISYYSGKYSTVELESDRHLSGTEIRNITKSVAKASQDFRAGVIWGAFNRYPSVYPTVDIAVVNKEQVLLGRKHNEEKFRFIGGFADPRSKSFEDDAKRELWEEAGPIECGKYIYLGSEIVEDWRYQKEADKIKTIFFVTNYVFGCPKAGDDIAEVKWFNLREITSKTIVAAHHGLFNKLMIHLFERQTFNLISQFECKQEMANEQSIAYDRLV